MLGRSSALVVGVVSLLAGCGLTPNTSQLPTSGLATMRAADDSDHAQMNAIVRSVLESQMDYLLKTADTNHDGAISRDEYAAGHDQDAAWLFQAQFDNDRNGVITAQEYVQSMTGDGAVEGYHHFTEEQMEATIKPYLADKKFDLPELRTYMTHDLGLTGDWPLISKVFNALDLNGDHLILSGPGEGSAFMLKFARQQMQHSLNLPVTSVQ